MLRTLVKKSGFLLAPLLAFAVVVLCVMLLPGTAAAADSQSLTAGDVDLQTQAKTYPFGKNLLVNGSGEKFNAETGKLKGWKDPDDAWAAETSGSWGHDAKNGKYYMWPKRKDLESTKIYQDVKMPKKFIGKRIILSAWLANYDQSPHDQSTLTLTFYNAKGKKISSLSQDQRNPEWKKHTIVTNVPKGTDKARVTLAGKRFVGSDLDSYFDSVSLVVDKGEYKAVKMKVNKKGPFKVGGKRTLTASYGSVKNPSAFAWYSSYDEIAKVSKKGKVTFTGSGKVTIYAVHKKTGVTGSFTFNVKQ